ncbi:MAG TPA: sugar phosphate isomerase/epimerase family protein [Planctomycetota bacterium]|nr:sugar phosphate isomerase/epimerase family protein [Planctomycetota bacterium]
MSTIGACRRPWPEALDAVVAAGFDAVEILMIPGWIHLDARTQQPAAARAELDRRGVRAIGVHGGGIDGTDDAALATSLDYVAKVIAFAGALGCEFVNVNGMPVADGTPPEARARMLERIIGGLRALLPPARRHGVRLTVENHHRFQIETIDDYRRIFAALPDAGLGATIDTWHFTASGISPAAVARALPRRIAHVHVKDIAKPSAAAEHRALARELARAGYAGWLSAEVELHDEREEAEAVSRSLGYLQGLAADAADASTTTHGPTSIGARP